MTPEEVAAFERCIAGGGVAVFPADTVYGLACDPDDPAAVERMYALKGRRRDKPAATMWFELEPAVVALSEGSRAVARRLLPGALTLILPEGGLRVPRLEGRLAPLRAVARPVLQTSANLSGGPDPVRLDEVAAGIRAAAGVVLDAGPLPGTPSTVVDLRDFAATGEWRVLREGAVPTDALAQALSSGDR
jgi:L-threonylcarbamoyladenylate synthase